MFFLKKFFRQKNTVFCFTPFLILVSFKSSNKIYFPVKSSTKIYFPVKSSTKIYIPVKSSNKIYIPAKSSTKIYFPFKSSISFISSIKVYLKFLTFQILICCLKILYMNIVSYFKPVQI